MFAEVNLIFLGVAIALLVGVVLVLVRAILGPTFFDRILAVNSMGTQAVLLIALFGFMTHRADFLDSALVYALMNFVTTLAVLKFVENKELKK